MHIYICICFKENGCSENIAQFEGKDIFWTLFASIILEPQPGSVYALHWKLDQYHLSEQESLSSLFIGHYRENYENLCK